MCTFSSKSCVTAGLVCFCVVAVPTLVLIFIRLLLEIMMVLSTNKASLSGNISSVYSLEISISTFKSTERQEAPKRVKELFSNYDAKCVPLPKHFHAHENFELPFPDQLANGIEQLQPGLEISCCSSTVLILGNSGSGRNTVTQVLARNLTSLYATLASNGQMVIFDNENQLQLLAPEFTVIPKYLLSHDHQTVFWDFPELDSEQRNSEADIAEMYYVKTVLDSASNTKVLFTLNYSDIERGVFTQHFDNLATQAVQLFNNLNQISDSVGLVFTNVPSADDNEFLMLRKILEALKSYVENIRLQISSSTDQGKIEVLNMKRIYAEIFLLGNNFPSKIALVPAPLFCGSLSQMPAMITAKNRITELYTNKLLFSQGAPFTPSFALTNSTKTEIETKIIPKTVQRIREQLNDTVGQFFPQFQHNVYNLLDNGQEAAANKMVTNLNTQLNFFMAELNVANNAQKVSDHLIKFYSLDFARSQNVKKCAINFVAEMEGQLAFYKLVCCQPAERPAHLWIRQLRNLSAEVEEIQKFVDFSQTLQQQVQNNYKIQGRLSKLVNSQTESYSAEYPLIDIDKMSEVPENFSGKKWNTREAQYLSKLVTGLVPEPKLTCRASEQYTGKYQLVVSGANMRFSEFVNTSRPWPNPCSEGSNLKEISIYASGTVFIDADLNANCQTLQLSLIAPKLVVIGKNRTIFLGCTDKHSYISSAVGGSHPSDFGKNGKNGKPGVNGGSFFSAYLHMESGENLRVNLDGDAGGDGQNGGRGSDGKLGEHATPAKFPGTFSTGNGDLVKDCPVWVKEHVFYMQNCYTLHGSPGGKGGDGGNGGDSGPPGKPGNSLLINIANETTNTIQVSMEPGKTGKVGQGGKFGFGRLGGSHISCEDKGVPGWFRYWTNCFYTINVVSPNGITGHSGNITQELAPKEKTSEWWRVINGYRLLFLENSMAQNFLNELDHNLAMVKLENVQMLAMELEAIENTRARHNDNIWSYKVYSKYLERLQQFAKHGNITSREEQVVLNYVYAVVLGQIVSLRQTGNDLNVINAEGYFNAILEQINVLESAQKVQVIAQESTNFEKRLNEKIMQSEEFVKSEVLPALAKAEQMQELATSQLENEVRAYLEAAKDNLEKEKELRRKFEDTLRLRYLMESLRLVAATCEITGPLGKASGTVMSTSVSVAESLLLQPITVNGSKPAFALPEGFSKKIEEQSKKFYDGRLEKLERLISATQEAVLKSDGDLDDLVANSQNASLAVGMAKGLKSAGNHSQADVIVNQAAQNLKNAINEKTKNLTKSTEAENLVKLNQKKVKEMERKRKTLKIIEKLDAVATIGNALGKSFHNLDALKQESKRLDRLVENATQMVKAAESKKDAIFAEFVPKLEEINRGIRTETGNLAEQSQAALIVKRWKLKEMLKGMKKYMTEFTKGMKVAEEFQTCVERLEEAQNLQISLFEHIENYQQQKQFADYMANLQAVGEWQVQVTDPELKRIIAKLEFAVQINLFLQDYQKAIAAFKHWVFPFAVYCLPEERLLNSISTGNKTLHELAQTYKGKVKNLSVQLKKYYASVIGMDQNLIVSEFVGDKTSTRPFYTWNNAKWHNSIAKLLSGQAVHFKADPEKSRETLQMLDGKAAVKYKYVELRFRTGDPNLQGQLDKALNNFQIQLTHSGVSIYEVSGQKYVMVGAPQVYRHSLEKSSNGNGTVSRNLLHEKVLGKADFLSSPYTWWTFRLMEVISGEGGGFKNLQRRFTGAVDLELVGYGTYLDVKNMNTSKLAELKLDAYYMTLDDQTDSLGSWENWNSFNSVHC